MTSSSTGPTDLTYTEFMIEAERLYETFPNTKQGLVNCYFFILDIHRPDLAAKAKAEFFPMTARADHLLKYLQSIWTNKVSDKEYRERMESLLSDYMDSTMPKDGTFSDFFYDVHDLRDILNGKTSK